MSGTIGGVFRETCCIRHLPLLHPEFPFLCTRLAFAFLLPYLTATGRFLCVVSCRVVSCLVLTWVGMGHVGAAAAVASPRDAIIEAVRESLVEAFGEEYRESNPLVTSATKPEFGDYQVGCCCRRRRRCCSYRTIVVVLLLPLLDMICAVCMDVV